MSGIKTKIGEGGRVVIPAEYRKKMGVKPGDAVILVLEEDGDVRITTMRQVIKRAQEFVREINPEGRLLSEELIQERRREAAKE